MEPISVDEVKLAIGKLSRHKASGLDQMKDMILHHTKNPDVLQKIAKVFTEWAKGRQIPSYLKTARITCLSKTKSSYPPPG
jgi:hypothetical protein